MTERLGEQRIDDALELLDMYQRTAIDEAIRRKFIEAAIVLRELATLRASQGAPKEPMYYVEALHLVADEIERMKPEEFDGRRAKLFATIRMAAQWMSQGAPPVDPGGVDDDRLTPYARGVRDGRQQAQGPLAEQVIAFTFKCFDAVAGFRLGRNERQRVEQMARAAFPSAPKERM